MLGGVLLLISVIAIYIVVFWVIANDGAEDEGSRGFLALIPGAERKEADLKRARKRIGTARDKRKNV